MCVCLSHGYGFSSFLKLGLQDSGERKDGELATADPAFEGEENVVDPDGLADPLSAEEAANFGEIRSPVDETQELGFADEERPVQQSQGESDAADSIDEPTAADFTGEARPSQNCGWADLLGRAGCLVSLFV